MYSVFLVEDEIVTREGIRNSIPWDRTPYTLAGEAPDGEMALSILRDIKPDILITDIKMPFMDGLALSRIVKKDQPWMKIIILSGHDEFQYAKEAISIGVEEYLLKPVSATDMLSSLKKVTDQIEAEQKRMTNIETLRMKIESTEEVVREKWLCNLVTGQIKGSDTVEKARSLGIDLIANGYLVLIVEIFTSPDNYAACTIVKSLIAELVKGRNDLLLFSQSLVKQTMIIKDISRDSLDDRVYPLAQAIQFEAQRRNGDCRISIGIGTVAEHIGEISRSYSDAEKAVRYMSLTGKKNILSFGDIPWCRSSECLWLDADPVAERLRFACIEEIDDILAPYMELLDERAAATNLSYCLLVCGDIIEAISMLVEEFKGDPHDIIPSDLRREHIIASSRSRASFAFELRSIIEHWIAFRDSRLNSRHHALIAKAKQYIDEHYMSQDISLNCVAAQVNVSPNHFSTIFSQEAGITFIDYLTSVRINAAKRLLSGSGMKCADIAYEVGYGDPHYFSFIFKKTMGIAPSEFRLSPSERSVPAQ
jgi:two-component system response regulator YesN